MLLVGGEREMEGGREGGRERERRRERETERESFVVIKKLTQALSDMSLNC